MKKILTYTILLFFVVALFGHPFLHNHQDGDHHSNCQSCTYEKIIFSSDIPVLSFVLQPESIDTLPFLNNFSFNYFIQVEKNVNPRAPPEILAN